jgi:hypothetical protein
VIGGYQTPMDVSYEMELISLDPRNYPVPTALSNLEKVPERIYKGGALLTPDNASSSTKEMCLWQQY